MNIDMHAPITKIMHVFLDGSAHEEAEEILPDWTAAWTDVLFHAAVEAAGVVR